MSGHPSRNTDAPSAFSYERIQSRLWNSNPQRLGANDNIYMKRAKGPRSAENKSEIRPEILQ